MKWIGTQNLGMLCLAIWLIAQGALVFISLPFLNMSIILGILALITGILLLIGR